MPCGVRDKFFLNPHFVIRDAGTLRWFAGLPAAVCGWTLEAIKPDRGDPPVQNGAGFDGAYTAAAGHFFIFPRIAQNFHFIFYIDSDGKNVHFVRVSGKIFLQTKILLGSCNVVLRARAVRSFPMGSGRCVCVRGAFFFPFCGAAASGGESGKQEKEEQFYETCHQRPSHHPR